MVSGVQIKNLQVDPCELNVDYPVTVHNMVAKFIGNKLVVAGGATVARDLEAPVTLAILMRLNLMAFRKVITVPCTNNFGSCTYQDICTLPEKLGEKSAMVCGLLERFGFPCKCPIPKGSYDVSRTEIPFDASLISSFSGSYGVQVNATHNGQPLGCYQITFSMG
ncbi:Ganglioside GM2 activator [Gryllus bimaculatus]|nr:Ganglioside GM2 activator [Gryllus bimaculatus]